MGNLFKYHTKDANGTVRDGTIEALDENEAVKKLQEQGLVILSIEITKDEQPKVVKEQIFNTSSEENTQSATKKCPYCAEEIKKEAIVCRFCNRSLEVTEPQEVKAKSSIADGVRLGCGMFIVLPLIIIGIGILVFVLLGGMGSIGLSKRSEINANTAAAKATVRSLSTAAETYSTANYGVYPADVTALATFMASADSYCGNTSQGYRYTCDLGSSGYTISATPESSSTGSIPYTATTGGSLTPL